MNTQPSSTPRVRRLPAVSASCALGTLALVCALGALPAAAQPAHAMAWIFDGPGCRGAQAESGVRPGACADEVLLRGLLDWLSTHLHHPRVERLPRLEVLDRPGLAARLCPGSAADCEGIMAAYDAPSNTVILRDFLDMRRAPDRSFLVHELIHVLQHQRLGPGFQARCSDVVNSEREAYQVQNRYLAAHGQLQRVGQMVGQLTCPREDGEPVMRLGQNSEHPARHEPRQQGQHSRAP